MAAWGGLPTAIRKAIATLPECQKKSEGEIAFVIYANESPTGAAPERLSI